MPLPFSFSTQRQSSDAERPAETKAAAISEKVMNRAPGQISTEPFMGSLGSTFLPPNLEAAQWAVPNSAVLAGGQIVSARSSKQHFADDQQAALPADLTVLQLPPSAASKSTTAGQDWATQIEQLRNDIFGIAMNVSALNDRLDRMEQRLPQAGQSPQASIATLRSEIEAWLESHLNAAVEHCMHGVINRTNSIAPSPVN